MTVVGGIDGYGPLSSDPTSLCSATPQRSYATVVFHGTLHLHISCRVGYSQHKSESTINYEVRKRMRKEKEKQNLDLGMSRDGEDEEKGAGIHFGKS